MNLTRKLLRLLSRVFRRTPDQFLALRLQCDGTGMTWQVADWTLTTLPVGGTGQPLSIDLSQFTVIGLVNYLAGQAGYSVSYVDPTPLRELSALVLLPASGDISQPQGDHLYGFNDILYAWMDCAAAQLVPAQVAIEVLPAEMATTTADGEWLDLLGAYYAVPRQIGETDQVYGPRIIATVLAPAGNNVALEMAILRVTGQAATITDVLQFTNPSPAFNGLINFDGSHTYDSSNEPVYGLFDCVVGYDLINGGTPAAFEAQVVALVQQLRDAGTQLRAVSLTGSQLSDTTNPATDAADSLTISRENQFNGAATFNGAISYSGSTVSQSTLSG